MFEAATGLTTLGDTLGWALLLGRVTLLYLIIVHTVPAMIWVERKGAALIQDRPGPNRVGPFGLLQPVADALKFLFKEDPIPLHANRFLYVLAPFLTLIPASLSMAALPFGDRLTLFGRTVPLQVANLDVGLLYLLSISSLGIYGILFGGWASNNKFSLVGAIRASSQVVSYEIPLALAAVGSVLAYGTFNLRTMALAQEGTWMGIPRWGVLYQPLGFLIFFVAAFAETNRLPFDLPETEAELVAGFHTEYGSMKFATFFMSEYMNLATMSGLITTLYFGAWHVPWIADATLARWLGSANLAALVGLMVFLAKLSFFLCVFVWVRWTIPRFRFDQLVRLSWNNLLPLGLFNIGVTAILLFLLAGGLR